MEHVKTSVWSKFPDKALNYFALQLAITDTEVRRGLLLLRPENVLVLGGKVMPYASFAASFDRPKCCKENLSVPTRRSREGHHYWSDFRRLRSKASFIVCLALSCLFIVRGNGNEISKARNMLCCMQVGHLEEARERMLRRWAEPPRSCDSRVGRVHLAQEMTAAAWNNQEPAAQNPETLQQNPPEAAHRAAPGNPGHPPPPAAARRPGTISHQSSSIFQPSEGPYISGFHGSHNLIKMATQGKLVACEGPARRIASEYMIKSFLVVAKCLET